MVCITVRTSLFTNLSLVLINLLEALHVLCLLRFSVPIERKLCPLHAACGGVLRKTMLALNEVLSWPPGTDVFQ